MTDDTLRKGTAQASSAPLGARNGGQAGEGFDKELLEVAEQALRQVQTSLMLAYRFLDSVLWRMPLEPALLSQPIATDGSTLWFDPLATLRRFRDSDRELARDVLHCLLHCLLRHPFDETHENIRAWWLACDMAVEEIAREMAGYAFPTEDDRKRAKVAGEAHGLDGTVTPQRLYEALAERIERILRQNSDEVEQLEHLEQLFLRDSHELWLRSGSSDGAAKERRDGSSAMLGQKAMTDESDGAATSSTDDASADQPDDSAPQKQGSGAGEGVEAADETSSADDASEAEQAWEDIAKHVQEDLETYSKAAGSSAKCLVNNLTIANRTPIDYADFLRRFATRREDMKVNDEEFDYIFYTYGMDTYGDMPLIEPLEYQETDRVRDFVIAIDTSGSCAGELIRNFIDRTFQMLQQSEHWGSTVNMHLIQCDERIREDLKITSMEELAQLSRSFKVKGMGATDFRPVFAYVDELVEQGEFDDLRGIIYFTDGYGTFPKTPPAYDTAFVFVEDEGQNRDVPPWAMKVILRNEQLRVL